MENKMSEVAKLLGVELNSDFNLKDSSFTYRLTERGLDSRYMNNLKWYPSGMLEDLLIGNYQIIRKPRSILDPAEKKYLGNIIKPFRDRIVWIKKIDSPIQNYEYIKICYHDHNYTIVLNFPDFKVGKMYKGMETNRQYTLEELGL